MKNDEPLVISPRTFGNKVDMIAEYICKLCRLGKIEHVKIQSSLGKRYRIRIPVTELDKFTKPIKVDEAHWDIERTRQIVRAQ